MNEELSISSWDIGIKLNRSNIMADNILAYNIALNIMQDSKDFEALSIEECRRKCD